MQRERELGEVWQTLNTIPQVTTSTVHVRSLLLTPISLPYFPILPFCPHNPFDPYTAKKLRAVWSFLG
jgi:hypothetical protein